MLLPLSRHVLPLFDVSRATDAFFAVMLMMLARHAVHTPPAVYAVFAVIFRHATPCFHADLRAPAIMPG